MRHGRRLTAVGLLTGGLLMVGFAAPSLAAAGDTATDTTVSSAASDTNDAGSTANADNGNVAESAAADEATQPQDVRTAARSLVSAAADTPGTLGDGNGGDAGNGGDNGNQCDPPAHDAEPQVPGCQLVECTVLPTQEGCPQPPSCEEDPTQQQCSGEVTCDEGEIKVGDVCVPVDPTPTCTPPDADPSDPDCDLPNNDNNPPPPAGGGNNPPPTGNNPPPAGNNPPPSGITPPTAGGTPPTAGAPSGNHGKGAKGTKGGRGPGASAGGSSSSNGSGSEGTVPGGELRGISHGTSACGDPAICNDSSILGVDASTGLATTDATTTADTTTVAGTGSTLPQTGAPSGTRGLLVLGLGLLLAGGLLVRPRRRLALHRA